MNIILKQIVKISTLIIVIIIAIIILYNKQIVKNNIAIVTENKKTKAKQIEYCSGSKIKEIFVNEEEKNTNEKNIINNSNFKLNSKMELNLKDQAKPYNIENINTKTLEDYMIISFEQPKDRGTNYLYKIQNKDQEKDISFYIKSDIKGYGYIINNSKIGEAPYEMNKMDNSPILLEKLNWNNDYYLHIRSFDGDKNYSESKTIKLDLPSKGVSINYIDANTNEELKNSDNIFGVAKQEYNINNEDKNIEGYTLINISGDTSGVLKKERINVKYEYAKNMNTTIKYMDNETKKEISERTTIEGYDGMQTEIVPKSINGYTTNFKAFNETISEEKQEINIYYDKIPQGLVKVKYVDKQNKMEISEQEIISNQINEYYNTEAKEIDGYDLLEIPNNKEGTIDNNEIEVVYYYKKHEEKAEKEENFINNKKEKTIEGYNNMSLDDINDNNESLIDELINSLNNDEIDNNPMNNNKNIENSKVKEEYEIVMNCDDSDYIIYYKK